MKIINTITKSFLASILLFSVSSCTVTTSTSLGGLSIDTSSIKITNFAGGVDTIREDKTFVTGETAKISFKANGLKIIDGKIKATEDVVIKNEGKEILNQKDFLGPDGITVNVGSSGNNGIFTGDVALTIKEALKGNVSINVTVRDLNAPESMTSFETGFTVK